ncbi:uncharacterized protein LOC143463099 [Clavelina lepadiformis]|uniref:uncharacterized protein LOC143463099 n=1 Tax=Clavelina lepadiformis TaxID=159417 RepID=UPI0040423CC8
MASKNKAKDAIVQLCKLLKHGCSCTYISPDHFRQAKHNQIEAISPLTQLLYTLLLFVSKEKHFKDKLHPSDFKTVFNMMKVYGYPEHRLSSAISKASISNELLLCFGWLLHCTKLLSKIRDDAMNLADLGNFLHKKTFRVEQFHPSTDYDFVKLQRFDIKQSTHHQFSSITLHDQIRYLSWLYGRIEKMASRLKSLRMSNARLHGEILAKSNRSPDSSTEKNFEYSYSVNELLMMRKPSSISLIEVDLERRLQILQGYLKWQQLQPYFWQWMNESVHNDVKREVIVTKDRQTLNEQLLVLSDRLSQMKSYLYDVERTWLERIKTNHAKVSKVSLEQEHKVEIETDHLFQLIENNYQIEPSFIYEFGIGILKHSKLIPVAEKTKILKAQWYELKTALSKLKEQSAKELQIATSTSLPAKCVLIYNQFFT